MNLRDMTISECEAMLAANRIGHLGCIAEGRPYVVPIRYVFRDEAFYSFSLPGKKIDSLRANPHACVQVEHLTTTEEWQSVVVAEDSIKSYPTTTSGMANTSTLGRFCRSGAIGGNRVRINPLMRQRRTRRRFRSSTRSKLKHYRDGRLPTRE